MLRTPPIGSVFEFGEFRFEPGNSRLVRAGEVLHAQPKALRVLGVLIENAGELVDREALFELVWDGVVVTQGAQTRLIRELRRLLGDDAGEPRFIETVHTRGYRWVAPVARDGGSPRLSNLPESTIGLIGRDADLERVEALVRGARLVTLAGPGGSGKTQLALELARRLAAESLGVVWVDLSSATDKLHCSRLLAAALDAREREDLALETSLARAIGTRELVLLLDNCEVVIHPVVSIARTLLAQCPGLTLLCTSQVTLDVPDEVVHWVRPLAVPDDAWRRAEDPVAALLAFDAVRLLVERARAVTPEFEVHVGNARAVAEVCRQLDGLPLALELAASRLATLTPAQLLEALSVRFALLERRVARPELRFRSLAAAIEWSYGLLDPSEQSVLDSFGVFAGPFTVDAARAVAGPDVRSPAQLLNVIQSLTQKSLLAAERSEREIRYRLLDSVKAFARVRLARGGTAPAVERRHTAHFVGLARDADANLLGLEQLAWLERLASAWPDLTAVSERLVRGRAPSSEARALIIGLRWYFWLRGMHAEGLQWFRGWRDLAASADAKERAELLNGVSISLYHATRLREAAEVARDAAAAARAASAEWELSFARSQLHQIAALDPVAAGPTATPRRGGDAPPDAWCRAFAHMAPALHHLQRGKREQALAAIAEVRAGAAEAGDRHLGGWAHTHEALLLWDTRPDEARRSLLRSVSLWMQISNPRAISSASECTAYLSVASGDARLGARFLGSAEAAREMTGAPLMPHYAAPHRATVARAKKVLGEAELDRELAAGRRMDLRETAALINAVHASALARPRSTRGKVERS